QFQKYSDFLKVVLYNNCGGPRLASYTKSMSRTLFGDLSPDEVLELTYKVQNYNGEAGAELSRKGLSANYVERETRGAVAGVGEAVKMWPGIDIDIRTGRGETNTEPQDVRDAVRAAVSGGADGAILSSKSSEIR